MEVFKMLSQTIINRPEDLGSRFESQLDEVSFVRYWWQLRLKFQDIKILVYSNDTLGAAVHYSITVVGTITEVKKFDVSESDAFLYYS